MIAVRCWTIHDARPGSTSARLSCATLARQRSRHEKQRRESAHDHAVSDQPPELLETWEIDEHQSVERRRRRPHAEQHALGRLGDGLNGLARGRALAPARADETTYSRTTPSTPRPNSMPPIRWRQPKAWRLRNPGCRARQSATAPTGSGPTATSHGLRNTRYSSGRMRASEPTVLTMLSRRMNASVSTAMRCPPANSTRSAGRLSSSLFLRPRFGLSRRRCCAVAHRARAKTPRRKAAGWDAR